MHRIPYGRISSLLFEGLHEDIDSMDYEMYIRFFDSAAEAAGMHIDILQDDVRLYSIGKGRSSIFIVSGHHGDERAGPIALLEMVRDRELPSRGSIRICPITHPEAWDLHSRKPHGLNMNRVWDIDKAPPSVMSLMMSIESRMPDVFLDLHESNQPLPASGEMHELRHAGTAWGHEMIRAIGKGVSGVELHTHIPGSSEKYAHELGVPGTLAVETNTYRSLSDRVEFQKHVVRLATGI